MGSGVRCDHWRRDCSKCGRRYHIVDGTTQCENCRKEHYEYDWKQKKMVFVGYRDTPVTMEDGAERFYKWQARQRLIKKTEKIRKEMGC